MVAASGRVSGQVCHPECNLSAVCSQTRSPRAAVGRAFTLYSHPVPYPLFPVRGFSISVTSGEANVVF